MAKREIDVDNLPSNNIEPIENERRTIKARRGDPRKHKRGFGVALAIRDISAKLFDDVLLPAAKGAIVDFVTNGIEEVIHPGGERGRERGRRDYGGYSSRKKRYTREKYGRQPRRASYANETDINDIYFDGRDEAGHVLGMMFDYLNEYGEVTLGWFLQTVGLESNHNHEAWGWTELEGIRVKNDRGKWYIDLPQPEPL